MSSRPDTDPANLFTLDLPAEWRLERPEQGPIRMACLATESVQNCAANHFVTQHQPSRRRLFRLTFLSFSVPSFSDLASIMSESDEPIESPLSEPAPTAAEASEPAAPRGLEVNDRHVLCTYANFCRVTGTPEELIVDFALNSQPYGVPTEPIEMKQRIVLNYFTAKRLLQALHMSVHRHEQAFGVLETDVQKRVIGRARA